MRIGQGFDVHQLVAGRKLIIGGVEIPYDKGLLGHSDADVLLHAICDALLGAAALGDIGKHFADTDAKYKDIDSRILLREVARKLEAAGYRIGNVDATIIAQAPKMAPHIPQMVDQHRCRSRHRAQRGEREGHHHRATGLYRARRGHRGAGSGIAAGRLMRILALETSTEYCSVALWQDGVVSDRRELVGQRHSEVLLPMLDACCEQPA